jgi:hypothetical protein
MSQAFVYPGGISSTTRQERSPAVAQWEPRGPAAETAANIIFI